MKTVTIYTTPVCPFSRQLRDFLIEKGVSFMEHNVIDEPDRLLEMQSLTQGSHSVPVIAINRATQDQAIFIGFDAGSLERALSISSSTATA